MIVYSYAEDTGELVGQMQARILPKRENLPDEDARKWQIPANATRLQPPIAGVGQVAVYGAGAWTTQIDKRGETWWTATGEEKVVDFIGDPAAQGLLSEKPEIAPTNEDVNAERDRRIALGFTFEGRSYQWNESAITSAATGATVAIGNGVQAGDLRWHGGDSDFYWTDEDNSDVPMDAPTVQALHAAMRAHQQKLHAAARALKSMPGGIPGMPTDDSYWT
ncbi:MAG: DUF4376 domain-containing protein [Filomicrobium sp.]